jgi:hypothetical protein
MAAETLLSYVNRKHTVKCDVLFRFPTIPREPHSGRKQKCYQVVGLLVPVSSMGL